MTRGLWRLAVAVFVLCSGGQLARVEASHAPAQGFGATTPGGAGQKIVRVTNLKDSGSGSLREALSGGNRTIVFDVAGEIVLSDYLRVRGRFVTIDGLSAPPPGITLRNWGIGIHGSHGAHDVIVRGLRIRDSQGDGIGIAYGATNVLVEHVSIHGSADGNLDITMSARDVTVAWSILGEPAGTEKNMLVKYDPARVTVHHTLFAGARQRNPQVRMDDANTPARETTIDFRNNLVWDWRGGYGTWITGGSRANVVGNYYSAPNASDDEQAAALTVDGARAFAIGNVSADEAAGDLDAAGTEDAPFAAPAVDTDPACVAALRVLEAAGARPLDAIDLEIVGDVTPPDCPEAGPPAGSPGNAPDLVVTGVSAPLVAQAGQVITIAETTRNAGGTPAAASLTALYLSPTPGLGAGARALTQRSVPALGAGEASTAKIQVAVPPDTETGALFLVAAADAGDAVAEARERNNTAAAPIAVAGAGLPSDLVFDVLAPARVQPGAKITVRVVVENRGAQPAAKGRLKFYLSSGSREVSLGSRRVPRLAPGEVAQLDVKLRIPVRTNPGKAEMRVLTIGGLAGVDALTHLLKVD